MQHCTRALPARSALHPGAALIDSAQQQLQCCGNPTHAMWLEAHSCACAVHDDIVEKLKEMDLPAAAKGNAGQGA